MKMGEAMLAGVFSLTVVAILVGGVAVLVRKRRQTIVDYPELPAPRDENSPS